MSILENLLTALDSLNANKLRSLLTMLGIIIGVAAVIALLGLGNGFSDSIEEDISAVGSNLIFITNNTDNSDGYLSLTMEDVDALRDLARAPDIADVTASEGAGSRIIANGREFNSSVTGVLANYFDINNLQDDLSAGDFFNEIDVDQRSRVAVIGWDVATELFEENYPIGELIKIQGVSYEVIGLLSPSGGGIGSDQDSQVFIPLTTHMARIRTRRTRAGKPAVSLITASGRNSETSAEALEQVTRILREEHDIAYASEDDFEVLTQDDLLSTVGQILGTVTLFLGAVAGISLLVGGIGIMNIMLVSVTERTREIGIRKSMGALRRTILTQFLIESLILSLVGCLIGIGLGYTISELGGRAIDLTPTITPGAVGLAVGVSMAVGVIFGIYPAWRAARLRPIDALRYE